TQPRFLPSCSFNSAIKPAQRGATALVPPTTPCCPSTRMSNPVSGSATPATSGTPRPVVLTVPVGEGTAMFAWYLGFEKWELTPPPVAPPSAPSFQTVSDLILPFEPKSLVPPQARTHGLDAGKSTCTPPSGSPSEEPLSPDATHTEIPRSAASWNAALNAFMACGVHSLSALPQLMEMTEGLRAVSWMAALM